FVQWYHIESAQDSNIEETRITWLRRRGTTGGIGAVEQ
ncbi:hypothetical protein AVEN_182877-1, partial [Araneus ventricosus]